MTFLNGKKRGDVNERNVRVEMIKGKEKSQ